MRRIILCLGVAFFAFGAKADGIPGFEDPALLGKVMGGDVVTEDIVKTKVELKTVFKAYFNASPQAFADVFVDHPHYADMVEEVKEGKTTAVNADRTDFKYWLHVQVIVGGFFPYNIYPEGHQVLTAPADALSDWKLFNEITNLKDKILFANENIRLILHEDGFLLEDTLHMKAKKPGMEADALIKNLADQYKRILVAFRAELEGVPYYLMAE